VIEIPCRVEVRNSTIRVVPTDPDYSSVTETIPFNIDSTPLSGTTKDFACGTVMAVS